MPAFHSTLYFSQGKDWGWVEQFWRQDSDLASALAAAKDLAQARYRILGAGVSLYRVRVSQDGILRCSVAAPITGKTLSDPAMSATQAMEVRLQSPGRPARWRNYPLRGLPRNGVQRVGNVWRWSPSLQGAGPAWLDLLVQDGWCLRVEENVGPEFPLTGLDQAAYQENDTFGDPLNQADPPDSGGFLVAAVDGLLPAGGTQVKIRGASVRPNLAKSRQAVNGSFPILAQIANRVLFAGSFGGGQYVGGGILQLVRPGLVPIDSVSLGRMVARKCGPPKEDFVATGLGPAGDAPPPGGSGMSSLPPTARLNPDPPQPGRKIQTARELAALIFEGYAPEPAPEAPLIQIFPVINAEEKTYLVCAAGVDNFINPPNLDQWMQAVLSWLGLPDTFSPYLRENIVQATESYAKIILAGHSMGGMSCEWMKTSFFPGTKLNHQVLQIVTFGSASIALTDKNEPFIRRFAVNLDPVPYFSPAGYSNWAIIPVSILSRGVLYMKIFSKNVGKAPGHVYVEVPEDFSSNPIDRHNGYPSYPSLDGYNWNGQPDPDQELPPLILGPGTAAPWPPRTPG